MPLLREEPGNLRDAIAAASGKLDGLDQSPEPPSRTGRST